MAPPHPGATAPALTPAPKITSTLKPSPTESPPVGTPEPSATGYSLPEQAITAHLEQYALEYVSDCRNTDPATDVGAYCSALWEGRGDTLVYLTGPTFSEADTWLLLARRGEGGGWLIVDNAPFAFDSPDTVPPWP